MNKYISTEIQVQQHESGSTEQDYWEALEREGEGLTGEALEEHIFAVNALRREMEQSQTIQEQIEAEIARAKSYGAAKPEEIKELPYIEILRRSIGWLPQEKHNPDEKLDIPLTLYSFGEVEYYFGSLIEHDNVARDLRQELNDQGVADSLMQRLTEVALPILWKNIISGTNVRREVGVNSTFDAFKCDVDGTKDKALILTAPRLSDRPVLLLGVMYDRKENPRVTRHFYRYTKKKK